MKKAAVHILPVLSLVILLTVPLGAWAQYSVTTDVDPTEVVKSHLIGEGVKVKNVKLTGNPDALGVFTNPSATPGFDKGIIISTGKATDVAGPNDHPKLSTVNATVGDKDLYMLAKGRTFDAALLEFDMMPGRDSLVINFFFASEEYNDYVGSSFSDALIIEVAGPGFPNGKNLAIIPGTSTPVNVNSVNYNTNGKYYIDNNPFTLAGRLSEKRKGELDPEVLANFQYDGMTRVFSVGTKVKPKGSYRVKIGIADAGDGQVDSALLIEAGSLQSIEQRRWEVRRQQIAEQRRQDSLARAAVIADSLARLQAIEDSLTAIQVALEQARQDSIAALAPTPAEPYEENPYEKPADPVAPATGPETPYEEATDDMDDPFSEPEWPTRTGIEILSPPPLPPETSVKPRLSVDAPAAPSYHRPPGPADAREYKAVIRYNPDDIIVADSSERLLKDIALFMRNYPRLNLGIYVPGATDNAQLRYDLIRLELIKGGIKPERIFRNGFSFLGPDESGTQHRAELWSRPAE